MIKVIKPGFYSSIQDAGRFNHRYLGVPVSGAMDLVSFNKANQLLGNKTNSAVIEITMTGPSLEFYTDTFIAITGAKMSPVLNGTSIKNATRYSIRKGDILSFGKLEMGFRAYLAIEGGFKTPIILDSRSFTKNITSSVIIKKNDELSIETIGSIEVPNKIDEIENDEIINRNELTVFKGPEYNQLSDRQLVALFSKNFTIAKENNRMAYQIKENIAPHPYSILTSAVFPGTVEITPSGKLIILMRDGQTTGGYPRILQLSEQAISILAQKKTSDSITFKLQLLSR